MKKFNFSMQNILNARAALKESCLNELARARHRLMEEQKLLEMLDQQIRNTVSSPVNSNDASAAYYLLQRGKFVNALKRKRKQQHLKVNAAQQDVQNCMQKLRQADIELKKMEKLQEREHEQWELAAARDEQKINDEIGTGLSFFKPHGN